MLISSFEMTAAPAKRQKRKVSSVQGLLDQAKAELERARELHQEEVLGMRTLAEANEGQLDVYQEDIQKVRMEAQLAYAEANTLRAEHEEAKDRVRALIEEAESSKVKTEASVAARQQTESELRANFLLSQEFKGTDKAFDFFETGFQKCREQVKRLGSFLRTKKAFFPSRKR